MEALGANHKKLLTPRDTVIVMKYKLLCSSCGNAYSSTFPGQECQHCKGLLEVVYIGKPGIKLRGPSSFWDFEPFLPAGKYNHYRLGGTPLIKSRTSENLSLKLEIGNPTRSFKDRGSIIEVSKAKEYCYNEVVCASTGNMAYSIAYYSKLLGLRAKVFISNNANKDKINYIKSVHDADITEIKGDFTKAQALAERYAGNKKVFLAGDYCYRKEGQKTIAYEIIRTAPETTHIIVPVGNATLISGLYKALTEMKKYKMTKSLPKLVAVEAELCKPLFTAFKSKRPIRYEKPRTAADAIAVGLPTFGTQALEALEATKGSAMVVTEEEMRKEQKLFYEEYGLIAELAGLASIAAFRKLHLKKGDSAVAIVSGGNV